MLITYFVHGTTLDNEQHKASGWYDVELSIKGREDAIKLKELIKGRKFDVIFCSDLKRAVEFAKLTFGDNAKIITDKRLREVNYGKLTRSDSKIVEEMLIKGEVIDKPFPDGESYKDVEKRMRSLLNDLSKKYNNKHIAIVAHRGPQIALDVITNGMTWKDAVKNDWRLKTPKEWKPGWDYKVK